MKNKATRNEEGDLIAPPSAIGRSSQDWHKDTNNEEEPPQKLSDITQPVLFNNRRHGKKSSISTLYPKEKNQKS